MAISRRVLLRTGAASVVVLGAGAFWASRQTARQARAPWAAASEGFGDVRLDALAYAILAPNPHNMQPWLVRLDGDDGLTVFADPSRLLPETDPPARQITIGFGCMLELLRQAAAENGFALEVKTFPGGEPQPMLDERPVAQVRFRREPAVMRDPLFAAALARHTQRQPFDTDRPVEEAQVQALCEVSVPGVALAGTAAPARRDALRALTRAAWITEWQNAATREESVQVTRIGRTEVDAQPWGICLDGAFLGTLGAVGLLSRESMRTPGETGYEQGMAGYADACDTAMAHLWSTTAGNSRRDQLRAGATWVRAHQAAAAAGLSFHPLSQALQEFAAMAPHYAAAHEMLAPPGHTVQMLVRLGYGAAAGPAPREPLQARILPA